MKHPSVKVRFAIRLALILLMGFVAFGAWWLWLRGSDGPATTAPQYLFRAEQSAIAGLNVTADGVSMAFVRREDSWRFESDPAMPVNLDRWGGIVLLLSGPRVERRLPAPDDFATYGLVDPSATIAVSIEERDEVLVRLGDVTPDGQHYYARVDGEEDVALVNTPWGDALRRLATAPPYPYWYYDLDPSLVRLFELEHDARTVTFLLRLPGEGGMSNRMVVNDGAARDLTPDELARLMGLIGGPPRFGIRNAPLPPDSVHPEIIVRLTYVLADPLETRSSYSAVYRITNRDSGGAYIATTDDTKLVLDFDASWVEAVLGLLETGSG